MAFQTQDIDQRIEMKLSEILRKNVTGKERDVIAENYDLKPHELKLVVYRELIMRHKHVEAVKCLVRICKERVFVDHDYLSNFS